MRRRVVRFEMLLRLHNAKASLGDQGKLSAKLTDEIRRSQVCRAPPGGTAKRTPSHPFRVRYAHPLPLGRQGEAWESRNAMQLKNKNPSPHQSASRTASPRGEALDFRKPVGVVRTLASPFGGGVRAQRRTERVNNEDPLRRLRRQLSQRESQVPSQSASLTALPEGEPRNLRESALPSKNGGRGRTPLLRKIVTFQIISAPAAFANRKNAARPSAVHLYTPASAKTCANTAPTSWRRISSMFFSVRVRQA